MYLLRLKIISLWNSMLGLKFSCIITAAPTLSTHMKFTQGIHQFITFQTTSVLVAACLTCCMSETSITFTHMQFGIFPQIQSHIQDHQIFNQHMSFEYTEKANYSMRTMLTIALKMQGSPC